jgi:kynurenine formamidase
MMKRIDLSHTVYHGLQTYPGLPAPLVCDYLSREASKSHYAEGTTFQIARIELVANTGTYVDSPFHRYEDGADLAALDLAALAHVPGLVVRATGQQDRAIDVAAFAGLDVAGKAVLVHTGWDRHWATPAYCSGHPFLTRQAAAYLRDNGARIVGIDSLNIDDTDDGARPVHSILLGAGIPIVEHLCSLQDLPSSAFYFHAVPVKFQGVGTFPVRAYALVGDLQTA